MGGTDFLFYFFSCVYIKENMVRTKRVIRRRKTTKKRTVRRGMSKMRVRKSLGSWYPFGKSRTCKLRYHESVTIDPSTNSVGTFVYSANGMYDPNISGIGHQPYGFDQLMLLYNKYTVTGARIKITAIMPINAAANAYPFMMGVKLADASSLNTSTPYELLEQPGLRKKIVSNVAATASNSVTCNFSAKKFFRRKSKSFVMVDDELHGNASSNPSNGCFFIMCYAPVIAGGDLPSTTFQVQIDYCATFTGPKELVSS